MLWPIVDHVAALAEGREVGICVVRGVVVPMGRRQDDPGPTGSSQDVSFRGYSDPPAPAIAPPTSLRVPPAAIPEVVDQLPVRTPTPFAAAPSPAEPDHGRELRPVDRVEEAVLGPDRHGGRTVPPVVKKA